MLLSRQLTFQPRFWRETTSYCSGSGGSSQRAPPESFLFLEPADTATRSLTLDSLLCQCTALQICIHVVTPTRSSSNGCIPHSPALLVISSIFPFGRIPDSSASFRHIQSGSLFDPWHWLGQMYMLPSPNTAKLAAGCARRDATNSKMLGALYSASFGTLLRPAKPLSVSLTPGESRDAPSDPYS